MLDIWYWLGLREGFPEDFERYFGQDNELLVVEKGGAPIFL